MPNRDLMRLATGTPLINLDTAHEAIKPVVYKTQKELVGGEWRVNITIEEYEENLRNAIMNYERMKRAGDDS